MNPDQKCMDNSGTELGKEMVEDWHRFTHTVKAFSDLICKLAANVFGLDQFGNSEEKL